MQTPTGGSVPAGRHTCIVIALITSNKFTCLELCVILLVKSSHSLRRRSKCGRHTAFFITKSAFLLKKIEREINFNRIRFQQDLQKALVIFFKFLLQLVTAKMSLCF